MQLLFKNDMELQKRSYPLAIIPTIHFKKNMSVDRLLKAYSNLMVVRLVKGNEANYKKEMDDGEQELSDTVFENSMPNLSMNLAGGRFDTRKDCHLPFLAISDYCSAKWTGKTVNTRAFLQKDNYSDNVPCFGLCFRVGDIHNKTFPFHKGFEKKEERDIFERDVIKATTKWKGSPDARLVGAFVKKSNPVEVHARLLLHHAPINGNYWHVTLDTYRPSETDYVPPRGQRVSSDRKMFKALKQNLLRRYEIDALPGYRIANRYYMKWYACLVPCFAK